MSELILSGALADLVRKNVINDDDVLMLRRDVYADGIVNSREATSILALDRSCREKCAAWDEFFVEALGDYLVYQTEPRGHISPENAEGIMRAISMDKVVDTRTELRLLLYVMKRAHSVPPALSAFALEQVKNAVLHGKGVVAKDRALRAGVVTAHDVDMIKTILYSGGGQNGFAISREEADVLFDINDATAMAANDPAWRDLFSKAIAAAVMMVMCAQVSTREETLRRDIWMQDTDVNMGSFMSGILSGGLRGFVKAVQSDNSIEALARARNAAAATRAESAVVIDTEEAEWLIDRIGRDGRVHENEKALLRFIAEQAPEIAEQLAPLIEQAA